MDHGNDSSEKKQKIHPVRLVGPGFELETSRIRIQCVTTVPPLSSAVSLFHSVSIKHVVTDFLLQSDWRVKRIFPRKYLEGEGVSQNLLFP